MEINKKQSHKSRTWYDKQNEVDKKEQIKMVWKYKDDVVIKIA